MNSNVNMIDVLAKLAELEKRVSELQGKINVLNHAVTDLQKRVTSIEGDIHAIRAVLSDLEKACGDPVAKKVRELIETIVKEVLKEARIKV